MRILRSVAWLLGFALLTLIARFSSRATGQVAPAAKNNLPPPVQLTAEQDHQRMMDLLHITSIRRGADGDPKSPYAANYDEAKANLFPNLPDPLVLKNGKKVSSANVWWKQRRPELADVSDVCVSLHQEPGSKRNYTERK